PGSRVRRLGLAGTWLFGLRGWPSGVRGPVSRLGCAGRLVGWVGGDRGAGLPLLLDPAEVPDAQGHDPGDHEHPDDDEAGRVDVETRQEGPEGAVQVGVL